MTRGIRVRGGYQAPEGGEKPEPPTSGSGVESPPAPVLLLGTVVDPKLDAAVHALRCVAETDPNGGKMGLASCIAIAKRTLKELK